MRLIPDRLTQQTVDNLRRLDPAREHFPTAEDDLHRIAIAITEHAVTQNVETLPEQTPRHPRRPAWFAGATAAVLVVAVALGLTTLRSSGHQPAQTRMTGDAADTAIPAAYQALARKTNPLSATSFVDCDGASVPVPLLAEPGTAETGKSSSSAALRQFLAHNPFAGTAPVTARNWLLLAKTQNKLTFGQREGRIGVGTVVTLTRRGSSSTASSLSGCGPVQFARKQSGEPVEVVSAGSELDLLWMTDSNCGTGPARTSRVLAQVRLKQTPTAVHVLLISKPAPDAGPMPASRVCGGTGIGVWTQVHLNAPLGARTLIDDSRIPGTAVRISPR